MSWKEWGLLLGFVASWIVLNRWVLPWFGVNTCMSGSCGVGPRPAATETLAEGAKEEGEAR